MTWSNRRKQNFRDELTDAYRSYAELRMFVHDALGESLPNIAAENQRLDIVAFLLIEWAEARRTLNALWQAFIEANPNRASGSSDRSYPFVYGPAIAPEGFYGRSRLIREVRSRIGGVNPQCVNVVGMRRAGKSSLLRLIGEDSGQFFSGNCQPLVVSLDLTNACFHCPAGIQEGLRREIATKVGRSPWAENAGDDPFVFEDGLRGLRDQGWRLVVLLDEFEGIKQHLEAFQGWGEDWRAKASAELLTLVVVGQRPIGEIYGSLGLTSPFGNIFSQSIVGPLAAADWQQLVRDRRPETTAEEMDWIGRVSGGWAFYVQMAGAMLWECGDMAAAEGEFLFQARSHFGQLWKALKDKERSAMRGESARRGTLDLLRRFGLLRADGQPFSSLFFEAIDELEDLE
ncbi:MAG: effector-associated domain EAD1-containing protein [Cyanobacteria bacterium P01_C01_bin.89]